MGIKDITGEGTKSEIKGRWAEMLREELEETTERYRGCIFTTAYHYMKNSYDVDDTTQNVLIKYYHNKKMLESEEHRKNWLIRVTINGCKKMLILPWRSRSQNLRDYANSLKSEKKEQSELSLAVMELAQKYRVMVHLYYYEDYSTEGIAQLLGIRETAVSTRLLRVRNMSKEKLQEVWNEE